MKFFWHITLFLCFLLFAGNTALAQKKKRDKKNKTEERIREEAKESALTLPGDRTPYKAKFYEALRLKTVGDYNGAVALFEECIKMNPKDDAVLYVLANFYAGNRQTTKAKNYIEKAYSIDPDNIWYLELLAYIQQNSGDYDQAEESYKKLTDIEPYNLDWLYYYSEAQLYNSNIKGAISTYDRMITEAGPIPDLVHRKIEMLVDQGETEKVVTELRGLMNEYPDSPEYAAMLLDYYKNLGKETEIISLLDEMLEKDPNNPHTLLAMADHYNSKGDKQKTYEYLKKAFASQALEIDSKIKLLIDIHDNQNPIDQEAFELLEILIKMHGADAKTYSIQGDFFLKNGNRQEALEAFRTALQFDKTKYPIWHETLYLAFMLGQYENLYQDSKAALEYFPTISNIYLFAGVGALSTGRTDEAIEYLTIGKDFVVKDKLLSAEFDFYLGEAHMAIKEYDEALTHYENALSEDPSNAVYLNNFAYKLAVHNVHLDEALKAIQSADRISPDQPNFLDTYAWILFRKSDYSEALVKIKKAFSLSPKSAVIAEHYGDILFKLGEKDEAKELWLTSRDLGNKDEVLERKIETGEYYERNP